MSRTVRQAVVFISGPSDVDRLAKLTLDLVSSLDKVLGPRLRISLQPRRGNRDAPAGLGRPQSRINPLVDDCDLFLGVFRRRVGSPTGIAQSGSIEEYERARDRRRRRPHVVMLFERLPGRVTRHPGNQLRALLRFRERIREEVLWVEFKNEREFQLLLMEQLVAWMLRFRARKRASRRPVGGGREP